VHWPITGAIRIIQEQESTGFDLRGAGPSARDPSPAVHDNEVEVFVRKGADLGDVGVEVMVRLYRRPDGARGIRPHETYVRSIANYTDDLLVPSRVMFDRHDICATVCQPHSGSTRAELENPSSGREFLSQEALHGIGPPGPMEHQRCLLAIP
jgi:hypothetical protein